MGGFRMTTLRPSVRRHGRARRVAVAFAAALGTLGPALLAPRVAGSPTAPRVLLVGTYHRIKGGYNTVQSAVDAAHPGDWILVGPGDYHEQYDHTDGVEWDTPGGVVITRGGIHLRGMDRNGVVVDGAKQGATPCSSNPGDQDYGVKGADGRPLGRNGVLIWKAANVSVENLTVCNFLAGADASGNEIWWDGAANSGQIGGTGFYGSYLNATSTFFGGEVTAAQYRIL